jgi:hypothetical protein
MPRRKPRAPTTQRHLDPLDRLLRQLALQATDPAVRRWARGLVNGEAARGPAAPAVPEINGAEK